MKARSSTKGANLVARPGAVSAAVDDHDRPTRVRARHSLADEGGSEVLPVHGEPGLAVRASGGGDHPRVAAAVVRLRRSVGAAPWGSAVTAGPRKLGRTRGLPWESERSAGEGERSDAARVQQGNLQIRCSGTPKPAAGYGSTGAEAGGTCSGGCAVAVRRCTANGKEATATVTWCGCQRGVYFEGCFAWRESTLEVRSCTGLILERVKRGGPHGR